jgi:hypothetical protein
MTRVLDSRYHPAEAVDPFGLRPCRHARVLVHTTDGDSLGDDLVECRRCGWSTRLADLYAPLRAAGVPPLLAAVTRPGRSS